MFLCLYSKKISQPPPGGLLDSISNIFGYVAVRSSVLVPAGLWGSGLSMLSLTTCLSTCLCLSAACLSVFSQDSSHHTPGDGLCVFL